MFYTSNYKNTNHNMEEKSGHKNLHGKAVKTVKSWKGYINELLDEYCKFGSLHGLRYIREPSIPRTERFLWLGIFLTFLYVSWNVVWGLYKRGYTQEFQLVFNPIYTPIWDIPFPAVLVCSAYPIRKSVFDIVKEVDNVKFKQFSKLVCPNRLAIHSEVFNGSIDEEFFEFIHKAAIPCQDLIVNCYWRGRKRDCCSYFSPILTQYGFCYIFNSLPGEMKYRDFSPPPGVELVIDDDLKYWTLHTGYPRRDGTQARLVRPHWSENAGPMSGLRFDLMDIREEWQEICSGSLSGFQLAVYPPDENFETETIIRIPHNEHSHIKLNPDLVHASSSLRSINKYERECVFSDEVKLQYFNQYSQSSCHLDCFINKAVTFCGCVPFSSYRVAGVYNYHYCNDSKLDCMMNVLGDLMAIPLKTPRVLSIKRKCTCLPVCSWLGYDYQTSFQQIVTSKTLPPWSEGYNESLEENFARVSIYFPLQQFNTIDRRKSSSLGDFLGNCGGLLGLFLGFSFMSLFEVIYFALIRPLNKMISLFIKGESG